VLLTRVNYTPDFEVCQEATCGVLGYPVKSDDDVTERIFGRMPENVV
jgi:hypothetical protein